jgi:hypothetical protein
MLNDGPKEESLAILVEQQRESITRVFIVCPAANWPLVWRNLKRPDFLSIAVLAVFLDYETLFRAGKKE